MRQCSLGRHPDDGGPRTDNPGAPPLASRAAAGEVNHVADGVDTTPGERNTPPGERFQSN
jgi:hypothetical protein